MHCSFISSPKTNNPLNKQSSYSGFLPLSPTQLPVIIIIYLNPVLLPNSETFFETASSSKSRISTDISFLNTATVYIPQPLKNCSYSLYHSSSRVNHFNCRFLIIRNQQQPLQSAIERSLISERLQQLQKVLYIFNEYSKSFNTINITQIPVSANTVK